jgi:hypothetical protein
MIRYYIGGMVNGLPAYVELEGSRARLLAAEDVLVDPFSRVAVPPLASDWDEGLGLSEEERRTFEAAACAYTRASVASGAPLSCWVERFGD